jgi:hypothetical protein
LGVRPFFQQISHSRLLDGLALDLQSDVWRITL